MWNKMLAVLLTIAAFGIGGSVATADEDEAFGAALAKYMPSPKVTLQQALTAAESQEKPISAKYEVDEGHFQLSVYTAQEGKFSEVLVDHNTGKVTKTEAITEGEDLADAKKQIAVCAKSTKSLQSDVDRASLVPGGERCSEAQRRPRRGGRYATEGKQRQVRVRAA